MNLRNPRFTYTAPGAYSVRLVVTNAGGSHSLVRSSYITVGSGPVAGPSDATLLAAGDIATCSATTDSATADLIAGSQVPWRRSATSCCRTARPRSIRTATSHPGGRTSPATGARGNHEYTGGAAAYFAISARRRVTAKGYYSYDLGTWHVVVLNSNCTMVSCSGRLGAGNMAAAGSGGALLRLHARLLPPSALLLGAGHGNGPTMAALEGALRPRRRGRAHGHDHDYERFARQNAVGAADPVRGMQEFVVGTGGVGANGASAPVQPNSQVRGHQRSACCS